MSSPRSTRAVVVLTAGVGAVLTVLLAAGCEATVRLGAGEPSTPARPREARTSAPPVESSPTAASSPSSDTGSPSPAPPPPETAAATATPQEVPPGAPLAARLLTAEEVPTLETGEAWAWRAGRTRRSEVPDPFATCHRFAMTSVGATRVVVRGFRAGVDDDGGPTAGAGHLVAQFADAKTARTAYDVLRAWQRDCAEQLREHERAEVGALQEVPVPEGEARWYLLTYGPPAGGAADQVYLDAQGMALHGSRVAVLWLRLVGVPADGSRLTKPTADAVTAAAGRLG